MKEEAAELAEFALAIQKEQEVMKEPPTKKRKGEHELFKIIDDIMNPEDANEYQPLVITNLHKANAEVTRCSSESSTSGVIPWPGGKPILFATPSCVTLQKNIYVYQQHLCHQSGHLVQQDTS